MNIRTHLRALRVHQWMKNTLLLIPVITSHQIDKPEVVKHVLIAIVAFCFASSAVYVVNDLLDVKSDRNHPVKRHRPFASGELGIANGLVMIVVCIGLAWLAGMECGVRFVEILAGYFLLATLYSCLLKKELVLDVLILSMFYTLRIFAGSVATGIFLSVWLLVFSMFFFFCLALVKRYAELLEMAKEPQKEVASVGRSYITLDLPQIGALGVSSGMISVLVLALYVLSPEVLLLYHNPEILLLLCPVLVYWTGRLWMLANRGRIIGDPVLFALKDVPSYVMGAVALAIVYWATL
jgi:4-hydroxybenzoate polyprenyltransferase